MDKPDLSTLTLAELRRDAMGDGGDPYAAVDELHRRAQANERLREAADDAHRLLLAVNDTNFDWTGLGGDDGQGHYEGEFWRGRVFGQLRAVLAAAPAAPPTPAARHCEFCSLPMVDTDGHGLGECAPICPACEGSGVESTDAFLARRASEKAPPTPAAPVTDAEIEAAIDDLCEAAYDFEASGCDPEGEAARVERDKQHALVALIACRVASAGAAPVDSEREAAIETWRVKATCFPCGGYSFDLSQDEIDEAVRLMRSAPPAPAGDQDAKLRELRARLLSTAASLPNRQMGHSDEDFDRGYVEACENWAQEIDRLLAAPAASAIAAAPEAPKREPWEERWNDAETGSREELLAMRDGLSSHARRIEALERANNKEAGK